MLYTDLPFITNVYIQMIFG